MIIFQAYSAELFYASTAIFTGDKFPNLRGQMNFSGVHKSLNLSALKARLHRGSEIKIFHKKNKTEFKLECIWAELKRDTREGGK